LSDYIFAIKARIDSPEKKTIGKKAG